MTDEPKDYWTRVRDKAAALGSDGCSFATGAFADCCLEHDIAYRTHQTVDGVPTTRDAADQRFRACMQSRSRLGWYSPLAWIRYGMVRWRGGSRWAKDAET